MEIEGIIAALSLALSICLAFFYLKDRKAARFNLISTHATTIQDWHEKVVVLLISMKNLKLSRDSVEHLTHLAQLSALIEQGRFLFPNIDKGDHYGKDKPPAYQGYRNLALDFLVASHKLLKQQPSDAANSKLELLQKHFTSIVHEIVNPRDRLNTIRSFTDRYFIKDSSFEDFLEHRDNSIISHIWSDPEARLRTHAERRAQNQKSKV